MMAPSWAQLLRTGEPMVICSQFRPRIPVAVVVSLRSTVFGVPKNRVRLGVALAAAVALLTACSPVGDDRAGDDTRPVVLTTFTVLADIARNVGGDHVVVESLTKLGAEIHGYEPTPRDLARARKADLIVDNGMKLEAWFGQFVASLDVPHVVASKGVEPIPIAGDAHAGKPNPHAWMSPRNVQVYVDNLVAAFSDLVPEHAADFTANGRAYQRELQQIQDDLETELARVPEQQRALVTCEGAFSYLARDAGLDERYIWPVNAEQQSTPQRVAAVIEFVRSRDVPAVFCESTVSAASMRQVVAETDATFAGTLYVDSLSKADGPVPTYLDLIRHDARTITEALGGRR